jgi:ABC-type lipoprotein release transport system permease subunit
MRGVHSATPFVHQQALFTTAGGGARAGSSAASTSRRRPCAHDVKSQLRQGRSIRSADGEPAILLGRELARQLGVFPATPSP